MSVQLSAFYRATLLCNHRSKCLSFGYLSIPRLGSAFARIAIDLTRFRTMATATVFNPRFLNSEACRTPADYVTLPASYHPNPQRFVGLLSCQSQPQILV